MTINPGFQNEFDAGEKWAVANRTNLKARPAAIEWSKAFITDDLEDGTLLTALIGIPAACTVNGITWIQATAANATEDNENRVVLFKVTGPNAATLVASSANSATTWTGAAGVRSAAFSTAYEAEPGYYYAACLTNWSAVTTKPAIDFLTVRDYASDLGLTSNLILEGSATGQTTLPDSLTLTSLTATGQAPLLNLY